MTTSAWSELVVARPALDAPKSRLGTRLGEPWDANPRIGVLEDQEIEVFGIEALARALNRSPITIRRWENEGTIPACDMWLPSSDPRGRRRRYTREWISELRAIAADEGILERRYARVENTEFPRRAFLLKRHLRATEATA